MLAFAGQLVYEKDNAPSQIQLLKDSETVLEVAVEVNQLESFEVNTQQGTFARIHIPGYHHTQTPGEPQLPVMNTLIEIPFGADLEYEIEILDYQVETLDLSASGIGHPLLPAQPSVSKSQDPRAVPFRYKQTSYERDVFLGGNLAELDIRGIMRDTRLALLTLRAVHYNPVRGKLKIYRKISLEITFNGADLVKTARMKAAYQSPYFSKVLSSKVLNYKTEALQSELTRYPVKYVIVADPQFETALQPFIQWKQEKGFQVIEGYTDDPQIGNTTSSIQNYLHNLYDQGTETDPAPTFVLFAGDVGQIPAFSGTEGGHITDLYYCEVNGDMLPDMYHGRFSAQTVDQLMPQIEKTLSMEQLVISDESFTGRALLVAGWDTKGHTKDWGHTQINYGTQYYFNIDYNFTDVWDFLTTGSGQFETEMFNHASEGVTFINYTGHGSRYSWGDPSFTISDINALQNSDKYPTVVGNCCLTNTFDNGECFGEAWLRAADKGAVGYIGGTNATYWDEDLWWGVGHHTIQQGQGGAPPDYEDTGMGAYDGNFVFDYNTQAAMILAGNLAVEEANSSRRDYYWEIYELMGDPSYMTYMGTPRENNVVLPAIIPVGASNILVEADAGSYIAVSKDGEIHGTLYQETGGTTTMGIDPFLEPGPAKIVITGQNKQPVIETVNVIVPSVVAVEPDTINIAETTSVTVTVYQIDGTSPIPDVDVWVTGWGVDSAAVHGTTGSSGMVTFDITPTYGEQLQILGKRPADDYLLFDEDLFVSGGMMLTFPNITASVPSIGLFNRLTPYYEGQLISSATEEATTLLARGCGVNAAVDDTLLVVTPQTGGDLRAVIAKPGYQVYTATVPVEIVYGTINGIVRDAAQQGIAGAHIKGYAPDQLDEPLFTCETAANGTFSVDGEFAVGNYVLAVEKFGYLPASQEIFLQYGSNNWYVDLGAAPSGILSGIVTESESGTPLDATLKIFRQSGEEWVLYTSVITEVATGGSYGVNLPYFTYQIKVSDMHHISQTSLISLNSESQTLDFSLTPTSGNILVIDDDSGKRTDYKVSAANGNPVSENFYFNTDSKGQSAAEIAQVLTDLGYYVVLEAVAETDAASWADYDLLISSSGANSEPISDDNYLNLLKQYVNAGGKLLIEGGELGYDMAGSSGDPDFARDVLHISAWEADNAGSLNQELPAHPIASLPNTIPTELGINYSSYGDEDACTPTADAQIVYSNNNSAAQAGIIVYDDNEIDISAQIVFYTFAFDKLATTATRADLLANTVLYLITPEILGSGILSGRVDLLETEMDAAARVEILGTGFEAFTDNDGNYIIENIYPGVFDVRASKPEFTSQVITAVKVANDSTTQDFNFALAPLQPVFVDDFEAGPDLWELESPWGLTQTAYNSPDHSLTDSPDGNSPENQTGWSANLGVPVDIEAASEGLLQFRHQYDIGAGDQAFVEISGDGAFWELVKTFQGAADWEKINLSLTNYIEHDVLWLRFRMKTDGVDNLNGWHIDDVKILMDSGDVLIRGDVTQDGNLNVADIVRIVDFILNNSQPTPVEFWCADINNDQDVNVEDIVKMVDLILHPQGLARSQYQPAEKITLYRQGKQLRYQSDGDIAGLQIVLDNVGQDKISWAPQIDMQKAMAKNLQTGKLTILLYSVKGQTLKPGEKSLLLLPEKVNIKQVIAADPYGRTIKVEIKQLPSDFALHQNYPNPFNPTTTINFDLPKTTPVKIIIYNMLGQKVRTLVNTEKKYGYHRVLWNGLTDRGAMVSSGVYIYRVVTPEFQKTRKMVLMK